MAAEATNATAFGAAGIGFPSLMWALDKMGYALPHWLIVLVLIASIICIFVSVALWVPLLLERLGWSVRLLPSRKIPFHDAALRIYEAAEKAGVLDLMVGTSMSADAKLNHFKMLLMVDDEVRLYGAKPPSTKVRLIPKNELLDHELYPAENGTSELWHLFPHEHPPAYVNVAAPRNDLQRVTKKYLTEYVVEAKQMSRR